MIKLTGDHNQFVEQNKPSLEPVFAISPFCRSDTHTPIDLDLYPDGEVKAIIVI